ncbi:hypothetical protein I0C86_09100 [Plantactinospora sp. S1510]|uniref:Uncharacterized protein n=1 Tax=Plantactinospora alkalitolerans TaxID=2789879 RepID=A0ABS0GSG9_9ACTN|nr:hypothetical protein [Plantactinospora alkalitolerans]MBF9129137.1 hypothetical protein [Plantactinospora alkalitolerans]
MTEPPEPPEPAVDGRREQVTDRLWRWDRDVPLRWLLVDEHADDPGLVLGVCAEIDGLFVDLTPPPEPERYTLLGCEPAGRLRAALDRIDTDGAWLGNLVLDPIRPADEDDGFLLEHLLDVVLLGHRPSDLAPGLVDIDLR